MAEDSINELATRIYEALKAKGADIGNASVPIIEAELNHFADDTRQAAAQDAYERAAVIAESEPVVWNADALKPQERIAAKIRTLAAAEAGKEGKE